MNKQSIRITASMLIVYLLFCVVLLQPSSSSKATDASESAQPTNTIPNEDVAIQEEAASPDIEDRSKNAPETSPDAAEEFIEEGDSEPSQEDTGNPLLDIEPYALATNERVVKTFLELRDALATDNGITKVYFGANIIVDRAGGVAINSNKADVVVSGYNPLEPDQAAPYSLTDYSSGTFTDTIYIISGTKNLLVQDLKIVGKNFYGSFSAYDSLATAGLVISYARVDYNGPQMAHNRKGTLRFIDCTVRIHGGNGGSVTAEFAEAKTLQFEGRNTLETATNLLPTFWQPLGGTFEILDNSSLTLTATNMGTGYGLFYADGSYDVNITIGQRAVFDATISGVFSLPIQATMKSLTVEKGGAFQLRTTKTTSASVLVMGGNLSIEQEAAFKINGFGGASYAVLEQRAGDITVSEGATFHIVAASVYDRLVDLYGHSLLCTNPSSVLLYNATKRVIQSTSGASRLYINAEQINNWTVAGTGGLSDPSTVRWKKADGTNFWMDGSIAAGVAGNFGSITSNYAAGDWPGAAPNPTGFSMVTMRVLSLGRLVLNVNTPNETSNAITGVTAPGATVRASFTQGGTSYIMPDVLADSNGDFSVPVDVALAASTSILVRSNYQFLTSVISVSVERVGRVEFIVPDELRFFSTRLSSEAQTVQRLDSNWSIMVSDTRAAGSQWKVYARATQLLTPTGSTGSVLSSALVFIKDSGVSTPLLIDDVVLISEHTTASKNDITTILWAANRGILIRVLPGAAFVGTYAAGIEWILTDAP